MCELARAPGAGDGTARRKVKPKVQPQLAEELWRVLVTRESDLTWTAAADGLVLTMWSGDPGAKGWRAAAGAGLRWDDFVHPDDRPAAQAVWDRVRAGGLVESFECSARVGDRTWVRVRQTMIGDAAAQQVLGVAVDLTAGKLMTEASAAATARFRARFVESGLAQVILDGSGSVSDVNEAFCSLIGRARADLIGCPVGDLTRVEDGSPETLASLLAAGGTEGHVERLLAGPNGTEVPVFIDATAMRSDEGEILGAAAFVHDLTSAREAERHHRQKEAFFASVSRLAGDLAIVGDAAAHLFYVSPAVTRVLDCTAPELLALDAWDWVHADDRDALAADYQQVVRGEGTRRSVYRFRSGDGSWRWMEQTMTNLLEEAIGGVVCNLRDITAQVEAHVALRESEARYRSIADTAQEGIWSIARTGETLYANQRMATILGLSLPELYRRPATELLDPHSAARLRQRLAHQGSLAPEHFEIGYQHPSEGERRLWIAASPLPSADDEAVGSLAMVSDITETRRLEHELRWSALHDALTGLANRALLVDRLERALSRGTGTTAVLMIDLDHFKNINDSRGHDAGDAVLVSMADRLARAVRPHDTVSRFGGDEFVILLEDVALAAAVETAQAVLTSLAEPLASEGGLTHVTASIGIALSPPDDAADLLRFADTAMYAAKGAGRDRVRVFDTDLADDAELRFTIAGDLRQALAKDELEMHFQPIIDLQGGDLLGMEALARWDHPRLGALSPSRFVPVAETSGLGPQLDRWAIRAAIRGTQLLRSAGAVPVTAYVSINLTAGNLSDQGLEDLIGTELEAAGMSAENLMLEITESSMMKEPERALEVLRRLRASGYALAIDDFGTGYSSLVYVRDLPVTALKIDGSFVADIRGDLDALAIVASIVDLSATVGVTAIAEGVESVEQCALLRGLGCRAGQGWLWAGATSVPELVAVGGWPLPFDIGPGSTPPPRRRKPSPVTAEHGLDRMMELHGRGASLATIAAALNVDGYVTPKGLRWHSASVARAIADAVYPLGSAPASEQS